MVAYSGGENYASGTQWRTGVTKAQLDQIKITKLNPRHQNGAWDSWKRSVFDAMEHLGLKLFIEQLMYRNTQDIQVDIIAEVQRRRPAARTDEEVLAAYTELYYGANSVMHVIALQALVHTGPDAQLEKSYYDYRHSGKHYRDGRALVWELEQLAMAEKNTNISANRQAAYSSKGLVHDGASQTGLKAHFVERYEAWITLPETAGQPLSGLITLFTDVLPSTPYGNALCFIRTRLIDQNNAGAFDGSSQIERATAFRSMLNDVLTTYAKEVGLPVGEARDKMCPLYDASRGRRNERDGQRSGSPSPDRVRYVNDCDYCPVALCNNKGKLFGRTKRLCLSFNDKLELPADCTDTNKEFVEAFRWAAKRNPSQDFTNMDYAAQWKVLRSHDDYLLANAKTDAEKEQVKARMENHTRPPLRRGRDRGSMRPLFEYSDDDSDDDLDVDLCIKVLDSVAAADGVLAPLQEVEEVEDEQAAAADGATDQPAAVSRAPSPEHVDSVAEQHTTTLLPE